MRNIKRIILLIAFLSTSLLAITPKPLMNLRVKFTWVIQDKIKADFSVAIALTFKYEGFYSNHAKDRGGMTYMGITRNCHPKWEGWKVIDKKGYLKWNEEVPELLPLVLEFYETKYWSNLKLNELSSQLLATEIMDKVIHNGHQGGLRLVTRTLNTINDTKLRTSWKMTEEILQALLQVDEREFMKAFNTHLKNRYYSIVSRNPSQKIFLKSWLTRINYIL